MTQIPNVSGAGATSGASNKPRDLRDLDVEHFLKLMIAEMQNQDPLSPMDNSQMIAQINQLREISATDKLTDTLDAVLLGQNLTTASSLIGKQVSALTDDARDVKGTVDRVSVDTSSSTGARTLRVHIGNDKINLKNIREIVPQ
jgi:flagellar basal-body rod modification protein FlgD